MMCSGGGKGGMVGQMVQQVNSPNRKGYFSYSVGGVPKTGSPSQPTVMSGLRRGQRRGEQLKTLLGGGA